MPVLTPTQPKKSNHPSTACQGKVPGGSPRKQHFIQDPAVGLMLRVQRDEPGAFAELVQRFGRLVFGRFYRQLGDFQEAEDLAQDVFLRLYRHRKRYEPRAKFSTWLFHIVQNVARNAIRSRRRHPCLRLDALTSPSGASLAESSLAGREEGPSGPIEREELAGTVRTAVAELAGRQRTALELQHFQNWTYAQIAAKMDMTPEAAKSLLYRARNQLHDRLVPYMKTVS